MLRYLIAQHAPGLEGAFGLQLLGMTKGARSAEVLLHEFARSRGLADGTELVAVEIAASCRVSEAAESRLEEEV